MIEPARNNAVKIPDRGLATEDEKASRKRLAEEGDTPVLQGASGKKPAEQAGAGQPAESLSENKEQDPPQGPSMAMHPE